MATDPTIIPHDEAERMAAVRRYDVLDTPPDGAFERITALAARHFDVPIAIVSIVDSDRIWFKSHHGIDVEEIGRDPGLCASAILQRQPWVVQDAAVDPRALANPLVAGGFGLRFYAGAPLMTSDGYNLGTLCLLDQAPRELTEEESRTLTDMAAIVMDELELRLSARTAVAHESHLRAHAERTARSLQDGLLPPELPVIPGLDLAALYRPADAGEVGGDFYDVFERAQNGWAIVIGDVSGKGAAAAAVTALARHTVRTAALSLSDPAEVLSLLNRAMFLGRGSAVLDHFCTVHLSFVERDGDGFTLRSAVAGHPPGLHVAAGATPAPIVASGPPVGWHDETQYAVTTTRLAPGDAFVVYTDGLSEARSGDGFLGEEGLVETIATVAGASARGIAEALGAAISAPGVTVRDDAAALVAKVTGA